MNILSLFDGISCGRLALDVAEMAVTNYYASEVDPYAINTALKNYPTTRQLGDVTKLTAEKLSELPRIDLLIGGSPCQDISLAKRENRKGLKGDRSKLFFEYLRIYEWLREHNNADIKFLLENVKGSKQDIDAISDYMGVQPVFINSDTVNAHTRKRFYWTNIEGVEPPIPAEPTVKLADILESGYTEKEKAYCITATYGNACVQNYFIKSERQLIFKEPVTVEKIDKGRVYHVGGESIPIYPGLGANENRANLDRLKPYVRKLTPVEAERLQGLPDNYTEGIPLMERYRTVGNGWTVPVIAHIFSYLK